MRDSTRGKLTGLLRHTQNLSERFWLSQPVDFENTHEMLGLTLEVLERVIDALQSEARP